MLTDPAKLGQGVDASNGGAARAGKTPETVNDLHRSQGDHNH